MKYKFDHKREDIGKALGVKKKVMIAKIKVLDEALVLAETMTPTTFAEKVAKTFNKRELLFLAVKQVDSVIADKRRILKRIEEAKKNSEETTKHILDFLDKLSQEINEEEKIQPKSSKKEGSDKE